MRRTLYCTSCGAARTVDTNLPMRGPGPTTCFKCAATLFTPDQTNAPQFTPPWLVTEHDRRLLRRFGIARGSAAAEAIQ